MYARKAEPIEHIKDNFSLSISDLMAGLMAIFILTICYFMLNFSQATAQLTQNDVKRAALLEEIHDRLEENGINVTIDEKHGILRISEGVLFDVGLADVKADGQRVITKLAEIFESTLQSEEFAGTVETVFIEGHTDNVPINSGIFPSNWELSTKRAINTWLLMVRTRPHLNQLENNRHQQIFSVSGYAETRPIADNASPSGRSSNRRIDIRFSMSPPTQDDISIVKFIRGKMNEDE